MIATRDYLLPPPPSHLSSPTLIIIESFLVNLRPNFFYVEVLTLLK